MSTMSSTFEIAPPGPEKSVLTSSENQYGIRRTPRVQVCVTRPVRAAADGEYVEDVMLRGLKMRDVTNVPYGTWAYFSMMRAPTMYICILESAMNLPRR